MNECVSDDSLLRYSVYVGSDGKYIHTIYPYHGKIEKSRYYKEDVGEGKEIHPVGCTDILKRMIRMFEEEMSAYAEECNELWGVREFRNGYGIEDLMEVGGLNGR